MALAGEAEFPRQGRLQFLDNQLDAATGTIRVRALFSNADGALTPGLFVRLRMSGGKPYPAVLVKDQAVGTDLDKRFVYVVGERPVDRLSAGDARAASWTACASCAAASSPTKWCS